MWQTISAQTRDLVRKSYSELTEGINNGDTAKTILYARALVAKAKSENNPAQIIAGYRALIYNAEKDLRTVYVDSMIATAKLSNDNSLLGSAYLTKGTLFYIQKNHIDALANFIIADNYIAKTNDNYLKYKTKYTIGQTKYYLGFYDEAISLLKECINYFEQENDIAYLSSLHSIGLCYNKINQYDLCSYYNQLGIKSGKIFENLEMEPYFRHSEAINLYFKKQYDKTIRELKSILPIIINKKDFGNETVANFYIAKAYWALKQEDNAIPYLIKVDKAFSKYNYIRPDLRENYELLIEYYKGKNNPHQQLHYINQLLKVDSLLVHNYKHLSKKIFREYDTKKLLQEKSEIEDSLKSTNKTLYGTIFTLSVVIASLSFRQYKNRKRYKKKFAELMNQKKESLKEKITTSSVVDLEINPDLVATILQNLEKFERNRKYLEKDMSLQKVAGHLKTNTKYASKIIFRYRNKKTIEYISDLKIDFIIERLKTENKFRNYTNKALAEEVGFGSTQNFTKAFTNKTGMPPTFFIRELKETFPL